jgi:hypothetical protein
MKFDKRTILINKLNIIDEIELVSEIMIRKKKALSLILRSIFYSSIK